MTYYRFKWIVHNTTLLCIVVNLLVKIGLIYGFQNKGLLLVGAIIDFCGVWFIAKYGRY
jgi:hypothetical protein